ncbi:MAG: tetraacyldisaccharide 4'-kinase [Roseobacter sp.]|jgi:tetraacyldisaccharide 4'-kinase
MRAPEFWYTSPDQPAMLARLLQPVGRLYARGTARRLATSGTTGVGIPVVCIGNINVGGTGKTPTVIALAGILNDLFQTPHIVTRGYGGTLEGPVRVDPAKHTAAKVGDEALLLASFAEVWVARDRLAGARAAAKSGASVIVLDDGFQNPSLKKDFSIVVVDATKGFGNERCLPAGPLREDIQPALARASVLLSIGTADEQSGFVVPDLPENVTHMRAELTPLQTGMEWAGARVLAFAGIGHPEKFFATLRRLGAELVHVEALEDHQPLTPKLMARLDAQAKRSSAQLVTTEKDAVRLPASFRTKVITVPVRLSFEDRGAAIKRLLAAVFQAN